MIVTKAVRIHHPSLRNCVFTLTQPSRPYPSPYPCPMCNQTHIYKTFHLNLDEHGDVCVAPEIYEMFKNEGILEDLVGTKEVTPAPTILHMDNTHQPGIIISREGGPVRI